MKREISPVVVIIAVAVLLIGIVGAYVYMATPRPPAGVKYTPGVPPWMEKGGQPYKPTPDYPRGGSPQTQTAPSRP